MNATAIDHVNVGYPADRRDEIASFYEESLGFELENPEADTFEAADYYLIRLGEGCVIHASIDDEFEAPSRSNVDHLAVRVDRTAKELGALVESEGLTVVDRAARLGAVDRSPSYYVEDPFGYVLELIADG